MKSAIILFFIIFSAACGAANTAENRNRAASSAPETPAPPTKQAVLIELFTSEG
jgi:hypothetical protein